MSDKEGIAPRPPDVAPPASSAPAKRSGGWLLKPLLFLTLACLGSAALRVLVHYCARLALDPRR